jgi:N-acetylmuramoyl-L-alanine amidase
MKKQAESGRKGVQSASVRRTQQTGRRQAAASARRAAGSGASAPPPEEVSVQIPPGLRRAFVIGLGVLALGMMVFVLARYLPGWRSLQLSGAQSTTPTVSAAEAAASAPRIGIVSGHRGNDSGSVCQDGLTEAQLNFDTSVRVAELLRAQGYTVDVLDEFDTRLKGYRAMLLLSIHADACVYVNDLATGFKVARVLDSKIPEQEDRLVSCLTSHYGKATGLRFHANTVTFDMTKYHAFYEIDERTPAAIIETGFMYLDRQILTRKSGQVAQGIADGLLCFIDGENP